MNFVVFDFMSVVLKHVHVSHSCGVVVFLFILVALCEKQNIYSTVGFCSVSEERGVKAAVKTL